LKYVFVFFCLRSKNNFNNKLCVYVCYKLHVFFFSAVHRKWFIDSRLLYI
jgi:hypothetical protein